MSVNEFATRYAQAWSSQNADSVASFFAENGSLTVNDGPAAEGRAAIANIARAFMTAFPDLVVKMDKLIDEKNGTAFHWTLTGTNTGAGGTGKSVRISGKELWQFDDQGFLARSHGSFDGKEYERQVNEGVDK